MQTVEIPAGYPWQRAGDEWVPAGWEPETELALASLQGSDALGLRVAIAAVPAVEVERLEWVRAWVRWATSPGRPMPLVMPAGVRACLVADTEVLKRAVRSKYCPDDVLVDALESEDPEIVRKAVAHRNLPHHIRVAHVALDSESGQRILAGAPNTPADVLRILARPQNRFSVRLRALEHPSYPRAEAVTMLATFDLEQVSEAARRPSLARLLLETTRSPLVAREVLDSGWRPKMTGAILGRLFDFEDHGVDAALARGPRWILLDEHLQTLTSRAIGALMDHGGHDLGNPRRPEPWFDLVRNLIVWGCWDVASVGQFFDLAMASSPSHPLGAPAGCWLCSLLTRATHLAGLPTDTAARLLHHAPLPTARNQALNPTSKDLRVELVQRSSGPHAPLLKVLEHHPDLATVLMGKDPSNERLAGALCRRVAPERAGLIIARADVSLRPRLIKRFLGANGAPGTGIVGAA